MNPINPRSILLVLSLLFSGLSHALLFTPSDCTPGSCWTSDSNSAPHENTIATLVGSSEELSLFYKAEVDNTSDEGLFANSYNTVFSNSATDPRDALTSYVSGPVIPCGECYLGVKGGNLNPSLYVFDLSDWNGIEELSMQDFWPNQSAISHIAIWGATASVTEPGTLALLGLGLLFLVIYRRRQHFQSQ